jgi:hypothetical protein
MEAIQHKCIMYAEQTIASYLDTYSEFSQQIYCISSAAAQLPSLASSIVFCLFSGSVDSCCCSWHQQPVTQSSDHSFGHPVHLYPKISANRSHIGYSVSTVKYIQHVHKIHLMFHILILTKDLSNNIFLKFVLVIYPALLLYPKYWK